MRRVKVRVEKRRVVSPPNLPEDFEGELTFEDESGSERLLEETNRAYAALRSDPDAWKEERQERTLWDETLSDGLEPRRKDS